MPQLSRFFGIVIYLFFIDHHPPHFHSWYGEVKCEISIADQTILAGSLSPRACKLVEECAILHKQELEEQWALAKDGHPFQPIDPLK